MIVISLKDLIILFKISYSECKSSPEVASSKSNIFGSLYKVLAMMILF